MIGVLHVITGLRRGGAEAMLVKLLGALDPARFQNRVVALAERGPLADAVEALGVPVTALGMRAKLDPLPLIRLTNLVRRVKPDVIQTWLYHADIAGLVAAELTGNRDRLIWNIRCSSLDFSQYPASTRLVVRLAAFMSRRPASVIVNSHAGRLAHVRLGYRPRYSIEIPNGFDLTRWRPDGTARARLGALLHLPAGAMIVGMVARNDPMKDHATFIAALALAAQRLPGIHGVLVGSGTEQFAPLIAERGLADRLAILGERGDLPALLPGFDALCLSSAFGEGFPNAIGEAMAAGVPCVATDVGDTAAVIGDTGRIVPPRQPWAMAEAMVALLEAPAGSRRLLGERARARIAERYGLEAVTARYRQVYEAVAAGREPN